MQFIAVKSSRMRRLSVRLVRTAGIPETGQAQRVEATMVTRGAIQAQEAVQATDPAAAAEQVRIKLHA
jgi:hypothetical protein